MKPSEIYTKLLEYLPNNEVSVCDLKTIFCFEVSDCKFKSCFEVLDFDKIKDEYCSRTRKESLASVDAIAIDEIDENFYFVEKKSSRLFLENTLSKKSVNDYERVIEKQLGRYDLPKKYKCSCDICSDILGSIDLFDNIPHAFVYLSDIDIEEEPILEFYSKLTNLSQTSPLKTSESILLDKTQDKVKSLSCNSVYLYCKDFDAFLRGEKVY